MIISGVPFSSLVLVSDLISTFNIPATPIHPKNLSDHLLLSSPAIWVECDPRTIINKFITISEWRNARAALAHWDGFFYLLSFDLLSRRPNDVQQQIKEHFGLLWCDQYFTDHPSCPNPYKPKVTHSTWTIIGEEAKPITPEKIDKAIKTVLDSDAAFFTSFDDWHAEYLPHKREA